MQIVRYLLLSFILILSTMGCERLQVQSSRISLMVPQRLSGKLSASGSTLKLKHLAVQVTAPDISQPIVFLQGDEALSSVTSEVSLEVPAGSNRLVQVLAAYAPVGSDGTVVLFYGDVSKALSGSSEVVDVSLSKLGGENLIEGRLRGRYLSTATSGPSGELKLFYRPAGKPSLMVDRTMMFGGWFDVVAFNSIPLDYVLPDGSLLAEQATTENLIVGPHLVRIDKPASYVQDWSSPGAFIWKPQTQKVSFFGFFAKSSSLLSDKTVCIQSKSMTGGTLYSGSEYLTTNRNNPVPLSHFPVGTTPQTLTRKMNFIGGRDISACDSFSLNDEFHTYLRFRGNSWGNQIYDTSYSTGIKGLHTYYVLPGNRYAYPNEFNFGIEKDEIYLEFRPLPGVLEGLDGYQFYTRSMQTTPAGMGMSDNRCEPNYLAGHGWSSFYSMPLGSLENGHLKVFLKGLTPEAGRETILCLSKGGVPYGDPLPIFYNANTNPSEMSLNISIAGSGLSTSSTVLVGECRPVDVQLTGGSFSANPYLDLNYSVAATDSANNPSPILYTTQDCAGAGAATITKDFSSKAVMSTFFVKSSTAGSFNLTTTNNKGLLNQGALYLNVTESESTPTSLSLFLDVGTSIGSFPGLYSFFSEGCHPVVAAFYGNNWILTNSSGTANITWTDGDGVSSYLPPSDVKIVDNCISKKTMGASIPVTSGMAKFAVDIGSSNLSNIFFRVEGLNVSALSEMNISPLAYRLALSSSAHNIPAFGSCIPVTVRAQDSAGNDVVVESKKRLSFYINTRSVDINSSGPSISSYADSACVESISNLAIQGGSSATSFYIKPSSSGSFYLNYGSSHVEVYSNWESKEVFLDSIVAP